MKKFIVTAIAAGALAVGGTASAQDIGRVITDIIGLGASLLNQDSQPTVTGQIYQDQFGRRFYYNQYGQQVYLQDTQQTIVGYDSWGRPIYGTASTQQTIVGYDSWGRPIYGTASTQQQTITGYDSWGRPIYGSASTYGYGGSTYGTYGGSSYGGSSWDRDGDGVANTRDRWPDDRRYW